jgi:1-acyl-sn-glycerol-3-phosphate acyltransferase
VWQLVYRAAGGELMLIANIRTVLFYLTSIPFTLIWAAFFGIFAYIIPYPLRYHIVIGGWARVIHVFTVVLLGIRVRVHGRENIPDGPCVVVANHQSAWETYYLQHVFAPQSQVAKKSLLKIPFFGWTFALMKPIAIDRSNKRQAMTQILEQGSERVADGCSILIFPEGTRSEPGKPLPFRKGGAVLAKKAGCPIIPVTHNSGDFWLNKTFAKKAGVVDLFIHPAIETDELTVDELTLQTEQVVVQKLLELQPVVSSDESKAAAKQAFKTEKEVQ